MNIRFFLEVLFFLLNYFFRKKQKNNKASFKARKYSIFEILFKKMKLAIVGVTGVVGREMLEVLSERKFPYEELYLVASEKSCGKLIFFEGNSYEIISLKNLMEKKIDLAFFSAGAEVSKIWAPRLAEKGAKVIDNSSYWRMSTKHKLIVPQINGRSLSDNDMIIANPNCSTIQLVMALAPIHKKFIVKRVVVSTYQAVSGSGKEAIEQLENEKNNINTKMAYPYKIFQNIIPQCDDFTENNYTKEEMKLTNETKKILDQNIDVVATAVRIPVTRGHSESVNITFENEFDLDQIRCALDQMDGVSVFDMPENSKYPMPINVSKNDEVFVGRIRRDFTQKKTLNMWIVSDNLRKGAATNTVEIGEHLIKYNLI